MKPIFCSVKKKRLIEDMFVLDNTDAAIGLGTFKVISLEDNPEFDLTIEELGSHKQHVVNSDDFIFHR